MSIAEDTATGKLNRIHHSIADKVSGAPHSATEKTQSAKQSIFAQRYIVGPVVYTKEYSVIGLTMASRHIKSEMSLTRLLLYVAAVLVVLGFKTFSGLSITVSKDNEVMSKFEVHPLTPRLALLTSAWIGLVSILATLGIPPAFGYACVHAFSSITENEKRKGSGSVSGPVSDERPISSTTAT